MSLRTTVYGLAFVLSTIKVSPNFLVHSQSLHKNVKGRFKTGRNAVRPLDFGKDGAPALAMTIKPRVMKIRQMVRKLLMCWKDMVVYFAKKSKLFPLKLNDEHVKMLLNPSSA
jgi:hypothetical protein